MPEEKSQNANAIFERGQLLPSDIITGKAWHNLLVEADTTYTTAIGCEVCEAGSRNIWHSHPGGQIIIVTDGVGYHQTEGGPIQILRKGDIAKCPPGVKHWHGASRDSGVTKTYIVPHTDRGIVNWYERVSDKEYNIAPK